MTKKRTTPTDLSPKDSKEPSSDGTNSTAKSRRRALNALVASGAIAGFALPNNWKKPVVNAVILPAHAQTSPGGGGGGGRRPSEGCALSINAAVLDGSSGALLVLALGSISAGCVQNADSRAGLDCFVITGGTTLPLADGDASAGQFGCSDSIALVSGCIVSCSVQVSATDHNLGPTDTVTIRFEFGGACVCTASATVATGT